MGKMSRDKGALRYRFNGLEWRTSPSAPDYEISEQGDIRRSVAARTRSAGHIVHGHICNGYRKAKLIVDARKVTFLVHRLVCEAFNGPQPHGRELVAHNDGNPLNNHFSNLRWATHAENLADRLAHGTDPSGERNPRARLNWSQVRAIRQRYTGKHGQVAALAREFGLSHSAMLSVCRGDNWHG